jgi:hypothetical protein
MQDRRTRPRRPTLSVRLLPLQFLFMRTLLLVPGCLFISVAGVGAQEPITAASTEVVILSTLHQYHAEIPSYSFSVLSQVIEQLDPDVLAVELTEADLRSRRTQQIKQEYPRSVFPLLDREGYLTVALEPEEPTHSELVRRFRNASQSLRTTAPQKAEAFGTYVEALYTLLFERWVSVAAVNSTETDALLEAKHLFQRALFGPDEQQAWEGWNRHFLARILDAAQTNPAKRILVLVGVEHAYWLRAKLREEPSIRVLDPTVLLQGGAVCCNR